ncbi:hypothetical protein [Bacillus pseudomycoides]|uniref:hypothetical protein n=1 Tax=Bacillus pseudomycoides TaxID=64104 RepID=UPI0020D202E0|nr:hypothetical protein [Bacillus pseudomycoides]
MSYFTDFLYYRNYPYLYSPLYYGVETVYPLNVHYAYSPYQDHRNYLGSFFPLYEGEYYYENFRQEDKALYAAIWEKRDGPVWQARHGLTAEQYQRTFNELVAQGYRLIYISGYTVQGQDYYAAIWEKRGGPEWQARHGLTSSQYQQTFNELVAQGYRLIRVSGYGSGGQDRYAAIWEKRGGPEWQARHGLTAEQYQRTFNELVAQGYRLIHVSGHTNDGIDRYAAIWEKRGGPEWQARHGLTAEQYQRTFNELVAQGYRLIQVSGYGSNGIGRFAAIWEKSGGPEWQARHGLTSPQYQQTFDRLVAQGYRLVSVNGYYPYN